MALELPSQLFYLRLEQGRVGEILPAARAQAARFPEAPVWQAALARSLLAEGRVDEAREALAALAGDDFRALPHDRGWLLSLALAAEVAWATGDARLANAIAERLRPYAGITVVAGSGLLHYGCVAYFLGLLDAVCGRWQEALVQLAAANEIEERLDAGIWRSRVQVARARVLHARDAAGDPPHPVRLAAEAAELARTRGWMQLAAEARDFGQRP